MWINDLLFVFILRPLLCLRSEFVRDPVIYMTWREDPWDVIFRCCSVAAAVERETPLVLFCEHESKKCFVWLSRPLFLACMPIYLSIFLFYVSLPMNLRICVQTFVPCCSVTLPATRQTDSHNITLTSRGSRPNSFLANQR